MGWRVGCKGAGERGGKVGMCYEVMGFVCIVRVFDMKMKMKIL